MSADKCMVRYLTGKNNTVFKNQKQNWNVKKYRQDILGPGPRICMKKLQKYF